MFRRTFAQLSKVITIPKLSPTHTQSRIVSWLAAEGQHVSAYDLVLELQCSADMVTEAFRASPDECCVMVIDTQDEGILQNLKIPSDEWIDVGTEIGVIDEDDGMDIDGPWTWQAYLKGDE